MQNTPRSKTKIVTPNVGKAKYQRLENGIKRFHLIAEPVVHELIGGVKIRGWGYNGSIPGPTIVITQGDFVQIVVENRLPEDTSIHWHGLIVSNRMDGVPGPGGSPIIKPGESFTYEFRVQQAGTFMYHSHVHNASQELMGLTGMFISRSLYQEPVHRDYVLLLQEWAVKTNGSAGMEMNTGMRQGMGMGMEQHMMQEKPGNQMSITPGIYDIDPMAMDYNFFTINGKAYPDTENLQVRLGERIRLRLGNLSMNSHPMHFHGHDFKVTATDGAPISPTSQWTKNTINVAPGETWDIEFTANNPGNWVFHCHKPHHTTNLHSKGMGGMLTIIKYV